MLGLFLLYFIWKYYADLAVEYDKNRWAYGLIGIASYYIGSFIAGIILALISSLSGSNFLDTMDDLVINLIAIPFGILSVWGLYKILKNKWAKTTKGLVNDSLDGDLINPE